MSVSSGRRPGGAQHTCSLEGQVFAGACVPSGSSIVFVSRAFVPLVRFAQVICRIGAREVISRKLLGKFAFAAKMYYLVKKVFCSWERRLSIWLVGRPVLAVWG